MRVLSTVTTQVDRLSEDTSAFSLNTWVVTKNADLLIAECAYKTAQKNNKWPHLNPEDAARLAKESRAKKLALVHFDANIYKTLKERKEAEKHWKQRFEYLKSEIIMDVNDITYAINGAVFEVNRVLGPGFLEKVYENALLVELKKRGLKAESQVPIKVLYKDTTVGEYIADLLVEEEVFIELKTVEAIDKVHEAQLLNYLKATGKPVGLLVNFKHSKAMIKRMVLNLPEGHDIQ